MSLHRAAASKVGGNTKENASYVKILKRPAKPSSHVVDLPTKVARKPGEPNLNISHPANNLNQYKEKEGIWNF